MRVERPDPDAYPIVYADDGTVLSDPNAEHRGEVVDPDDDDEDDRPEQPALGSTREKWADYATALGYVVPDDAGRDEIIAQMRSVGAVRSDS